MLGSAPLHSDEVLHRAAVKTMVKATRYFRSQVATNGGYLWLYQSDFYPPPRRRHCVADHHLGPAPRHPVSRHGLPPGLRGHRRYSLPRALHLAHYTFNDNAIADVIATMIEAHKIYGDERWRRAAERGGDFIILAQMPDPQPAWAQQYNLAMEPTWARRFEPPAITGGESFGVMQILLELYLAYGEPRLPDEVEDFRAAENKTR